MKTRRAPAPKKKNARTPRKAARLNQRKPDIVQGSMAGTATFADDYDPSEPVFPLSDWKTL